MRDGYIYDRNNIVCHHYNFLRSSIHIKIRSKFCCQKMTDFSLICPPQGKSLADDFAEHINQWVERRTQQTVSEIEFRRQLSVGKMSKEQKDLLKDIAKIRNVKDGHSGRKKTPVCSPFLAKEKARLRLLKENAKTDDYLSDGNSSDDGSSVYSFEDEGEEMSPNPASKQRPHGTVLMPSEGKLSAKKSSFEDRLLDNRITNLQRRYSAQVRTEPIVNVHRRLKFDKQ